MSTRGHDRRYRCGQTGLIHVGADGVCTSCGRQIRDPRPLDVTLRRIPEDEKGIPPRDELLWFAAGVTVLLGVTFGLLWVVAWAIGRMA